MCRGSSSSPALEVRVENPSSSMYILFPIWFREIESRAVKQMRYRKSAVVRIGMNSFRGNRKHARGSESSSSLTLARARTEALLGTPQLNLVLYSPQRGKGGNSKSNSRFK